MKTISAFDTIASLFLPAFLLACAEANAETVVFPSVPLLPTNATSIGSGGGIALNDNRLQAGDLAFQTRFDASDWSGHLLAYPMSSGNGSDVCNSRIAGTPCAPLWDAAQQLSALADNERTVISYDAVGHLGVPFRWSALGPAQQAVLNVNPAASPTADGHGPQRLDWLRGSHANESAASTPPLRARTNVLGDIVGSSPFFVGAPDNDYSFDGYAGFRDSHAARTPMVYVAANDGMLHGFRANDGRELLAYVPAAVFGTVDAPRLSQQTHPDYMHSYLVDGSPTVADAWFDGGWHSVLAGGLGIGGQAVYALDVTDPSQFDEAHAATLALWEFTDADDPDLGNTLSQLAIVRTSAKDANGHNRWAAVVSSGYDNTAADGHGSTDGKGAVFLLFLDHRGTKWTAGEDYLKLAVPAGSTPPNGMATPACVDIDGDGIVDRIYVGDLNGQLWRFDLSGSDSAQWRLAYGGHPLFSATDYAGRPLPITERPEVGYNPLTPAAHDVVVYFGSGRYLSASDNTASNQPTQSFFAIFDEDETAAPTIDRGQLLAQSILAETGTPGALQRITSRNTLDPARHHGWYIDLFNTSSGNVSETQATVGANLGERQITTPVLRAGQILFSTLIPPTPALPNGSGWLMTLDAATGSAPAAPAIDLNSDRVVNDADQTTVTIDGKAISSTVSGLQSSAGIPAMPTLLTLDARTQIRLNAQSGGTISAVAQGVGGWTGRVSWREVSRN